MERQWDNPRRGLRGRVRSRLAKFDLIDFNWWQEAVEADLSEPRNYTGVN